MERLLTPLLTAAIRRFIKQADGQDVRELRVGLSGGSLVLHNLELRVDGAWSKP